MLKPRGRRQCLCAVIAVAALSSRLLSAGLGDFRATRSKSADSWDLFAKDIPGFTFDMLHGQSAEMVAIAMIWPHLEPWLMKNRAADVDHLSNQSFGMNEI